MKRTRYFLFIVIFFVLGTTVLKSQTNTFPASGNVGIGTANPLQKLEVNGNIQATGSVTAGGQITVDNGAATSTYGFRHNGAGRYMRIGIPNTSFAYFETNSDAGFYLDGKATVGVLPNGIGDFVTATAGGLLQRRTVAQTQTDLGVSGGPFLPLTGGIMTGQLTLNNATQLNSNSLIYFGDATNNYYPYIRNGGSGTNRITMFNTAGSAMLTVDAATGGTFNGNVRATTAALTSNINNLKVGSYNWIGTYLSNAVAATAGNARLLQVDGSLSASANNDNLVGLYLDYSALPGAYTSVKQYALYQADVAKSNYFSGDVGIGTTTPSEKLSVNGNIKTKKLIVTQTGWPDYVFHPSYKLKPLSELKQFIQKNKHLPEMPSAKEVEDKGVSVGDNQALLLKKIEEITLYLLQVNQRLFVLEQENARLKKRLKN